MLCIFFTLRYAICVYIISVCSFSVISMCLDTEQYAVRVWHFINTVKHIHVHTQQEAERWWYRWKWEVIENRIYQQAGDYPHYHPSNTCTHTYTHLIKSLLHPHLYREHRNRCQLCVFWCVSSVARTVRECMCVCVRPSPASGCCTTHGGFRADMHLFKNITTCQDQRDAMWRAQEQWLVSSGCGHKAEALNLSLSRLSIQILGSGSLSPVSRPLSHVCMRSCLSRSVFVSPICVSGLHVDKRWLRFSLSSNTQSCSVSILIFLDHFCVACPFPLWREVCMAQVPLGGTWRCKILLHIYCML